MERIKNIKSEILKGREPDKEIAYQIVFSFHCLAIFTIEICEHNEIDDYSLNA